MFSVETLRGVVIHCERNKRTPSYPAQVLRGCASNGPRLHLSKHSGARSRAALSSPQIRRSGAASRHLPTCRAIPLGLCGRTANLDRIVREGGVGDLGVVAKYWGRGETQSGHMGRKFTGSARGKIPACVISHQYGTSSNTLSPSQRRRVAPRSNGRVR